MSIKTVTCTLFLFLTVLTTAVVSAETITCTECGMNSDLSSKFTSKISASGKTLYFCDIGDLLVYLNKHQGEKGIVEVKDYGTGDWISAQKATFVSDARKFNSPMGWGIAAFTDRTRAASYGKTMDWATALKAVK